MLLRLLDNVVDVLEGLEQRGVDLRAERGRFETVLNRLRRHERTLVTLVGAEMRAHRPPNAHWWWHLDEKVAADRRRGLGRVIGATLIGLAALLVLYLLYDRLLAPPPNIRQANAFVSEGERAAIEGNLARSIELFEAAVVLDPERAEAQVWLGILYESTGEAAKATAAFEHAEVLLGSGHDLLFQRGLFYLSVGDFDSAFRDAGAAIELDPQRPEGYLLLGSAAAQVGELKLAIDSLQQAADLAESTGQVALQAIARMRIARILGGQGETP
jgi:tetratricopeptide (TPR) repeat protein